MSFPPWKGTRNQMKPPKTIRIGTRGSTLAMWQANEIKRQLQKAHPHTPVEVTIVKTTGDINQDVALSQLPGKAFFTKEIEEELLRGSIDLAVHSGKDVPTLLPDGLRLAGCIARHSPLDAFVSVHAGSLADLKPGDRLGTSSLRRSALISNLRPDLRLLDLRGNVDTRLRKLDDGQYDGILLATAGLERLGLVHRIKEKLDPSVFPPAVSQGAMALEIRHEDADLASALEALVDRETTLAVTAERALLRFLEGGCQVPLGALARVRGDRLDISASIIAPDGSKRVNGHGSGEVHRAVDIGESLAKDLLARGGGEIMAMLEGD